MTWRPSRSHLVLVVALAAGMTLGGGAGALAQDSSHAPTTTSSNGGRSASDGTRSLSVSQADGLDPAGQTISVSGVGYPTDKGVYVAFCVIPPTDQPPSPCGGGRGDQAGSGGTGSSHWVSSNPPVYATGMTTPYGPGGTFDVRLSLTPAIADGLDCRQVRCAVATRADHTRSSDRSLDLFVPVTFSTTSASVPVSTTTAPPPAPTVATTIAPLHSSQVAPLATVAADSRSVTGGGRTLAASAVADLDPDGVAVQVDGTGFDPSRGIYVALCAIPDTDPQLPPGASPAPGPCTAGAEGAAAWISSNPPDYGSDLAAPYGPDGSFRAELRLRAGIDDTHDCRRVACALVSRNDDANASDRTQDLYLPVAFAPTSSAAPEAGGDEPVRRPGVERAAAVDAGGGLPAGLLVAGGTGVVLAGVGAVLVRRRRATR